MAQNHSILGSTSTYLNIDLHQSLFSLHPGIKGNEDFPTKHIGIVLVGIISTADQLIKKTKVFRRIEAGEIYFRNNPKALEADRKQTLNQ